jgi:hypothetical protein
MALLPSPERCTWLECEEIALVLEALASEMRLQVGPPVRGWRANARRQGKQSMAILVQGRALGYRLRQGSLRAGEP